MESETTAEAIAYPVQNAVRSTISTAITLCRRCGKEFNPPQNSRGSAKEYRCSECLSMGAFATDVALSCLIQ